MRWASSSLPSAVKACTCSYEREHSSRVAEQVIRPTGLLDPVIIPWATLSITAAWSSACAPVCRYGHMAHNIFALAGQGIKLGNAVDFIAEEFDADGVFIIISKVDIHNIAVNAELIADKVHIVAFILHPH